MKICIQASEQPNIKHTSTHKQTISMQGLIDKHSGNYSLCVESGLY